MQIIEKGDLVRNPKVIAGVNIWRIETIDGYGECTLRNGSYTAKERVDDLELILKNKPPSIFSIKAPPHQTFCVGDIVSLDKNKDTYYEVRIVEEAAQVEDGYALILSNGENPVGRYSTEVYLLSSVKKRLDSVGIQYTKQFEVNLGDIVKVLEPSKYGQIGKVNGHSDSEQHNVRVKLGQHSRWISKENLLLVAKKNKIYDIPLIYKDVVKNVFENDLVISQNHTIYEVIGEEKDDCIATKAGMSNEKTLSPKFLTLLIRAEDRLDIPQLSKEENNMPNLQNKDEMLRKQQIKINELTRENEEYRQKNLQLKEKDKEIADLKVELASAKEDYNCLHETSQQRINKLNDKAIKTEQTCKEEIERLEEELANQKHYYELSLGYKVEAYDTLENQFRELEIHNNVINHELEKQKDINKYKQVIIDNQREIIGRLED